MDVMLLETVKALRRSPLLPALGEIWQRLQAEKEEVSRDLLTERSLNTNDAGSLLESEAPQSFAREIEWRRRGQLEARLKEINDAQDRLIDGAYGRCSDCGEEIESKRLIVEPAAARCIVCQRSTPSSTASQSSICSLG